MQVNFVDNVNNDIFYEIFKFNLVNDLCNLKLVYKKFKSVIDDDKFWRMKCLNELKMKSKMDGYSWEYSYLFSSSKPIYCEESETYYYILCQYGFLKIQNKINHELEMFIKDIKQFNSHENLLILLKNDGEIFALKNLKWVKYLNIEFPSKPKQVLIVLKFCIILTKDGLVYKFLINDVNLIYVNTKK